MPVRSSPPFHVKHGARPGALPEDRASPVCLKRPARAFHVEQETRSVEPAPPCRHETSPARIAGGGVVQARSPDRLFHVKRAGQTPRGVP